MEFTWQIALLVLGILAFLYLIIRLEYHRTETQESKRFRSPLFVTLVLSFVMIAIVLVMEGLGVLDEGWAKEHWWVFILFMVGIFWYNQRQLVKLKPMKMDKLEASMWELVYRRCKARPHRGISFGTPLPYHNVTEIKSQQSGQSTYNKVVNFLARTTLFGGTYILVGLDIGNAYPLRYVENPDTQYVQKLFGREVAQQYDIERELLKKAIEPEEMQIENENYNSPQGNPHASSY